MRLIKHILWAWRTWRNARRVNKRLLAMVAAADRKPYDPPTPEEVKQFVTDMNQRGIMFTSRCDGLPRIGRLSREVEL